MITRAPFNTLENGDMAPTDATQRAYAAACSDLKSALATWTSISGAPLAGFNAALAQHGLKPGAAPY